METYKFPEKQKFRIKNKIIIEPDMFYSEAFMSLSASAIRALLRCLQKRKWENGKVHRKKSIIYLNDGFIFPYAEAAFLKIRTTQHWKNITKLFAVGFLDIEHQGGWYQKNKKEKDYSVFLLSERWRKYGTPDFKQGEKPKTLQKEYYIQSNIARKKIKATSRKRSRHLHDSEVDTPKKATSRLHVSEVDRETEKGAESLVSSARETFL
jgi:hypothetical protein